MVNATELRTKLESEMQQLARERNEFMIAEKLFDDRYDNPTATLLAYTESKSHDDGHVQIGDHSFSYFDEFKTVDYDAKRIRPRRSAVSRLREPLNRSSIERAFRLGSMMG